MKMKRRQANIHKFKNMKTKILVSTDIASRGLDIPNVELVINFDLPKNPIDYVHRVGWTAWAGRSGMTISVITQHDIKLVYAIEEYTGVKLEELETEKNLIDKILEELPFYNKVM